MYAALWESDRIMKSEREERECAAAIQRNKDCLEVGQITPLIRLLHTPPSLPAMF